MKIVFDNSIHLGQFCISDEMMRVAAKNSQIMLSAKPKNEVIGIETFNENSFSDDNIWQLPREPQDTFYVFMDVFHSLKNIIRIPLQEDDAAAALDLGKQFSISMSNALTCAVAIREKVDQIHTFYPELLSGAVRTYLEETFSISVPLLVDTRENRFNESNLETFYQNALACFKKYTIDLQQTFHS